MSNLITSLHPYLPMLFVVGLMLAAAKVVSILRQTDDSTMEKQGTNPLMIVLMAVLFLSLLLLANSMTDGRIMALLGVVIRNPMALPMVGMFAVKRLHSSDNGLQTVIFVGSEEECHNVAKDYAEDVSRRFDTPVQTICGDTYGVSVKNSAPFTITYHVNELSHEEALHFASLEIGDGERYALPLSLQELADDFSEEFNEKFYCKQSQDTDLLYLYTYIDRWSDADKEYCVNYAKKYGREIGSANIKASSRQTWDDVEYTPCLMVQMFVSPLTADELECLPNGSM